MMSAIAKAWDRFWFEPVPVTSVCLYRIGLGTIAFFNGLLYIPNFNYWFGAEGVAPMAVISQMVGERELGIFLFCQPNDTILYSLLALYIMAALCVAVGFLTRPATIILWILAVSFRNRNPFVWHSVDFMMILMLQLLIFTPAGARYSLDNALRKRRGLPAAEDKFVPWAQRLMQVQEAAIYFFAFWGKTEGSMWWQGIAVYYAVRGRFASLGMPALLDNDFCNHLLSWGTLAIEGSLFTLVWIKPLRYWVLAAGLIFHALINWSMDIDFLEAIMVLGYINFIYPEDLEHAVSWIKTRFATTWAKQPTRT